jgi:hypothetical protein
VSDIGAQLGGPRQTRSRQCCDGRAGLQPCHRPQCSGWCRVGRKVGQVGCCEAGQIGSECRWAGLGGGWDGRRGGVRLRGRPAAGAVGALLGSAHAASPPSPSGFHRCPARPAAASREVSPRRRAIFCLDRFPFAAKRGTENVGGGERLMAAAEPPRRV